MGIMNIINEEIRSMRQTASLLKKGIALEVNQSRKEQMKQDVRMLEELINERLSKTNDYNDMKLEEDVY